MIKAGDKVICIKTDIYGELPCEVGGIYVVDDIRTRSYDGKIISIVIFTDYLFDDINNFIKYFIPIAEWREQQIKSVLDDNN